MTSSHHKEKAGPFLRIIFPQTYEFKAVNLSDIMTTQSEADVIDILFRRYRIMVSFMSSPFIILLQCIVQVSAEE